jgi:tetratricopeptide (TPR) repeat protein
VEANMCLVLGNAYSDLHDYQSAEAVLSRGVAVQKQLPARSDLVVRMLCSLGDSQIRQRKWAEAERSLTEALAIQRERFGPNTWYEGYTLNCLGKMHRGQGNDAKTEAFLRDAVRIFLRYRVNDVWSLRCITAALDDLAVSMARQGKYEQAEPISRGSLELARAMAREMATPAGNGTLAGALFSLGLVLMDQGKYAEAAQHFREALDIQKRFAPDHPATLGFHFKLAESLVACNVKEAVLVMGEYVRPAAGKGGPPLHDLFEERIKQFRAAAEKWEQLNRTDASYYFRAACWRAVIASVLRAADRSPQGLSRADAEADRAMEWLKKAVDAGFTDRARIKEWDHLEALRDRDDYRRLVASLPPKDNVVAAAPGEIPQRGDASAQEPAVKAQRDPINGGVYNLLGFILEGQKKFEQAMAAYRRAIELDPKNAEAHNNLGGVLAAKGLLGEAIAAYEEAIHLKPDYGCAYHNLGRALLAKGLVDDAIAACKEAVRLGPADHVNHHLDLGLALARKGLVGEAIAAWNEALRLEPRNAHHHNNLAWLLATCPEAKFRDPRRAVELAQKAVELTPEEGSHWNTLGVAHYRAGDCNAAIAAFEKSMELRKGGDSFDWFFLAMAHWQLGEEKKAREFFDQALQWMDKNQANNEELRRFRAEAKELMKVKDDPM